jgi:hypothetical protein
MQAYCKESMAIYTARPVRVALTVAGPFTSCRNISMVYPKYPALLVKECKYTVVVVSRLNAVRFDGGETPSFAGVERRSQRPPAWGADRYSGPSSLKHNTHRFRLL